MKTLCVTQARHNRWANDRLYEAAAGLSPQQLAEDQGVDFGSVLGILNHLLLADRVWLHRFTGQGQAPTSVSGLAYTDFAALREAREAEDARIIAFAYALSPAFLEQILAFSTTSGTACAEPATLLLAHFFQHQAHHRGQVHGLLPRFGLTPPDLDLLQFQRETRAHPG
jgi:uncharacterized damage-inducible protein DinB